MDLDPGTRYAVPSVPGVLFAPIAYDTDDRGGEDRRFVWLHAEGEDRADVFPADEPVRAERTEWGEIGRYQLDDDGNPVISTATCGTCGKSWNDALITSRTPAPSARCPFEYDHREQ